MPQQPTTDSPPTAQVTAKIRGLASKWADGLLLGAVTASTMFFITPYSRVSSTIAIVLMAGALIYFFWPPGKAGRRHARRFIIALSCVVTAFLASAFGPFFTAAPGSYICLARPPAFGVSQSVPITVPLPSPRTVYVLGVDDPVRKRIYRWFFNDSFREISSPRRLEEHARLPLKHLHRRFEGSEDRVSLYHPAPLVSRSIQIDTTLSFGAYTSVRPLISHTMRLSAGVPSWEDVAVSIKSLSTDELHYIVLLTEALDCIAKGYGKEAIDVLTMARQIAPSADEQARIAVIQTFLAQQVCAGNLGEIQSLYFVAIAIRATEDAGIIQRRLPYLHLSGPDRRDQGEFVLPPERLTPLQQWIRTELRTHLKPFARYATYEPAWEGLALTDKAPPGLGRIDMPRPPDDCRTMLLSTIDDLADTLPTSRQRVHSVFTDTFDQVAGLSATEVADLVQLSRNELDRLEGTRVGAAEVADARFRLALLERAFMNRLAMAFACDFMVPVFHDNQGSNIRELDCLSPSPDERLALLNSYVHQGRETLSPSYNRLLTFYAAGTAAMSSVLQRFRDADADRKLDQLDFFHSIDPLLASEPQAARALLTSASSWHTDEYQRAFLQYVIGTSASVFMPEGPDDEIIAVFPFLADKSAWTLTEGTFASASSGLEMFLPGLLWEAVLSGSLEFDRRLLQDTGLSADELTQHLRPPLHHRGTP